MCSTFSDDIDFFEGAEKLLEVWFSVPSEGLRKIKVEEWEKVVKAAGASIVSSLSNDEIDSYVLSESSLFVWKDHFVLKTCGRTAVLSAFPLVQDLVQGYYPEAYVFRAFYSHKGFLEIEKQPSPYSDMQEEEKFLRELFPDCTSTRFKYGDEIISEWVFHSYFNPSYPEEVGPDATVEIIMYGLDPMYARNFFKASHSCPEQTMCKASGMDTIIPSASLSDVTFDPCGYSLNGLDGNNYFTVHVTPQKNGSYASFEIGHCTETTVKACLRILKLFRPENFCLTLVGDRESSVGVVLELIPLIEELRRRRCPKISYMTKCGYDVFYAWF